jgi:polyisoprenyl-phosphate glycosyltransferase
VPDSAQPVGTPKLSSVIPAFNEQDLLAELHRRLTRALQAAVGDNYEIVIVDDGSTDQTWLKLEMLSAHDSHVVAVKLSRNHGHQLALTAGLHVCRGERVFIIDADLQDPPELLSSMMKLMDDGADVVYGVRTERSGESQFKVITARGFYRLLGLLTEAPIPQDTGDFRLISRAVLDIINSMPEQHRFIRGMVSWIGMKQVPICYRREARFSGSSKYPLPKMIRFALDAVTSFSMRPLRMASLLGGMFGLLALVGILYVVRAWALGYSIQGWTSLSIMVLILGSVQLLVLGIIGEYLGRLFIESKRRPLFVIERICKASRGDIHDSASREPISNLPPEL